MMSQPQPYMGGDLTKETEPDATIFLQFRYLLKKYQMTKVLFENLNRTL